MVVAKNFAPGTTAADIESAMSAVGGEITSCRIIEQLPGVVAELVFAEKSSADKVITAFDKMKADGRILHLYMKSSTSQAPRSNNAASKSPPFAPPDGPRSTSAMIDLTSKNDKDDRQSASLTPSQRSILSPGSQYDNAREAADSTRRDARRIADPEIQDGSYGFMEVDLPQQEPLSQQYEESTEPRDLFDRQAPTSAPTQPQAQRGRTSRNDDREARDNRDNRDNRDRNGYGSYRGRGHTPGDDRDQGSYYGRRGYDRGYGGRGYGRGYDNYRRDDERDRQRDMPRLYSDEMVPGRGRGNWGRGRDWNR